MFTHIKIKFKRSGYLYTATHRRNPNSSGLQFKVVYWPALTLCGTAQLVVIHCPNKRTLDPQSAARQIHLCPSQPHNGLHTM